MYADGLVKACVLVKMMPTLHRFQPMLYGCKIYSCYDAI